MYILKKKNTFATILVHRIGDKTEIEAFGQNFDPLQTTALFRPSQSGRERAIRVAIDTDEGFGNFYSLLMDGWQNEVRGNS